jgi:threonine dehydratase
MVMLLERAKLVVEGAGAVGLAALLSGRLALPGKKVAVVLSGGNVDINLLARIIEHGMTNAGRYLMLRTCLVDQPGQLHRLTDVLAGLRVNILDIQHRRTGVRMLVSQVEVELTLETRDFRHGEEIIATLEERGYQVKRVT